MHYSTRANSCRVSFFKPSGKWYGDEAIQFPSRTYKMDPISATKTAIKQAIGDRYSGMTAVCLEPYCLHAYPVMVTDWVNFNEKDALTFNK
jgi:hypothetical protein